MFLCFGNSRWTSVSVIFSLDTNAFTGILLKPCMWQNPLLKCMLLHLMLRWNDSHYSYGSHQGNMKGKCSFSGKTAIPLQTNIYKINRHTQMDPRNVRYQRSVVTRRKCLKVNLHHELLDNTDILLEEQYQRFHPAWGLVLEPGPFQVTSHRGGLSFIALLVLCSSSILQLKSSIKPQLK